MKASTSDWERRVTDMLADVWRGRVIVCRWTVCGQEEQGMG